MAGKKGYEDPDRGRGSRQTPDRREKDSSEDSRDRDFGERGERHENPLKSPDERFPREPRT